MSSSADFTEGILKNPMSCAHPPRRGRLGLRVSCVENSLIAIKSSTAFFAQPSGVYHFDEEWTWTVLRVAQTILQHSHDIQTNIKTDEVCQSKRAHGMCHAKPEN